MNKTRVMLVDDHAVVRAGFRLLLSTCHNIEVVVEASRGEEAVQLYKPTVVDIVVMDLSMPGIGGLETILRLLQRYPDARVLVFSVHDQQVYVQRALEMGAKGYISKNSAPESLPEAIATVMRGEQYVEKGLISISEDTDLQQQVLNNFSQREFDIFRLLAEGYSVSIIAREMCLSSKTIANYATSIKKKLKVHSSAQLLQIAQLLGISQSPDKL